MLSEALETQQLDTLGLGEAGFPAGGTDLMQLSLAFPGCLLKQEGMGVSGHGYTVNFLLKTNTERDIPEVLARPGIAVNNSLHTRTDVSRLFLELLEGRGGNPVIPGTQGQPIVKTTENTYLLFVLSLWGSWWGMSQPPASMARAGWLWVFCLARAVPSCCLLWSF